MARTTHQRINITLSKDTILLLNRVAARGDRSRLLDTAVRSYIKEAGKENIRKLLKEGALKRTERDLAMTREWFPFEQEAWQERSRK